MGSLRRLLILSSALLVFAAVSVASADDITLHRCRHHHSHGYCRRHHFHRTRIHWHHAVASWYKDGGATASGWHATYGVADCGDTYSISDGTPIPCGFGARIEFCLHGCVTATVDDRGPYENGARQFDLGTSTAQAIGFSGVGRVRWRRVG